MKEKYKEIVCGFNDERTENVANRCVEIAEEFTIEFAEWLDLDETQDLIYSLQIVGELPKLPKNKELLEIFKKEYDS